MTNVVVYSRQSKSLAETSEQRLTKTNSRSVVGVMNEFVRLPDRRRDEVTGPHDLMWLSPELA